MTPGRKTLPASIILIQILPQVQAIRMQAVQETILPNSQKQTTMLQVSMIQTVLLPSKVPKTVVNLAQQTNITANNVKFLKRLPF
jgi:hypothetical protein